MKQTNQKPSNYLGATFFWPNLSLYIYVKNFSYTSKGTWIPENKMYNKKIFAVVLKNKHTFKLIFLNCFQ